MKIKFHTLTAIFVVAASAILLGPVGSASAADTWFVMGEQSLSSANPSAQIKTQGSRWKKDVKQVKFSVEGADVEITQIQLGWDNRRDKTLTGVGTIKAGGQTAPTDAPGRKGRLKSVTVTYKILGGKPSATFKVWGFD